MVADFTAVVVLVVVLLSVVELFVLSLLLFAASCAFLSASVSGCRYTVPPICSLAYCVALLTEFLIDIVASSIFAITNSTTTRIIERLGFRLIDSHDRLNMFLNILPLSTG